MKKISHLVYFIVAIGLFSGCASTGRDETDKLRTLLKEKKTQEALEYAKSEKFYTAEKDRLLKLLELGSLHFLNGDYFQALKKYDEAKDLSDKLFTISISKKIESSLANDNSDNYYGEKFERSLLRFYQALTHLNLYYSGKYESYKIQKYDEQTKKNLETIIEEKVLNDSEKRFHLQAARSTLIEWDSLLSSYKATTGGVATFKEDLLAKLFGALIHELLGSSNDISIAKNLYKSAKEIMLKYYNMYPIFNAKAENFRGEFQKLANMNPNELKNFIEETESQKKLLDYIESRQEALKGKNKHNVHLILEDAFIQRKSVKAISIPLPAGMVPAGIATGDSNFAAFTAQLLLVGGSLVDRPKFYFELPELKLDLTTKAYKLRVTNEKNEVVSETMPVLASPLSVIGHFNLEENLTEVQTKTGARFLGKQLVAIGSAYALYQSQKKSLGEGMAMLAATATYQIANKGIEVSERADLRSWTMAPRSIYLSSFNLKPGSYELQVIDVEAIIAKSSIVLNDSKAILIKNIRIFE